MSSAKSPRKGGKAKGGQPSPDTTTLDAGTELFRIHSTSYGPLWFGPGEGEPPRYRFDAPDGEYGALYVAQTPAGAFAEVFLREPRRIPRLIASSELENRVLSQIIVLKPLVLAKLRGPGLSWHKTTAAVSSSGESEYARAQQIALAVFQDDRGLDGIEYRSRHDDDELACVIFDRAEPSLQVDTSFRVPCLDLPPGLQSRYPIAVM